MRLQRSGDFSLSNLSINAFVELPSINSSVDRFDNKTQKGGVVFSFFIEQLNIPRQSRTYSTKLKRTLRNIAKHVEHAI